MQWPLQQPHTEALLSLIATPVLTHTQDHSPCLAPVYCPHRMQLATLPPDLLAQVCSALPSSGLKVDELLQPLRDLRPSNGGKGWDPEIGMQLRGLNFDLSADAVEE